MKPRAWLIALALVLALAGPAAARDGEALYQVSLLDALLAGDYQGSVKVGELTRHGDLGLGTFDALDGEMVVSGGTVYRVDMQGVPRRVPPSATTPFAQVTTFKADLSYSLTEPLDYASFQKWVQARLPSANYFYAIRVTGAFDYVKARSVPRQKEPYPPLAQAAKKQAVFEWKNLQGELIGFLSPAYMKGIGAPGWHLHFLGAAKKRGGHLLAVKIRDAVVEVDLTPRFMLVLPKNKRFMQMDLERDRAKALKAVEQGKH
ncbi:MAG: acetolactate decarboxylase [Desulfarculaceae bacterium]|nr:acetolactate decarboxylase [Desulfarculaceae bacterium]MCF8073691.1 acetolactate decarboxylase [Desulfarculaceae bacterium]MCF8101932.1 acetolactate decarboxylase [Desulfarculaceae bacterium]MCF8115902.1 acetolactate decarboxylase [Desulfarculaceae bacterium]